MYPILVKIGDFTLHTYGVLLAIGFFLAVVLALKEARRMLGNLEEFRDSPIDAVKFWRGGLVFYGGLIFAFLTGLWYVRTHHLNFRQLADLMAPSIAIGQALGRLGCFSAG
jgi:phosphatidylglycerol:prolipoprotein diacylglycerol transferase